LQQQLLPLFGVGHHDFDLTIEDDVELVAVIAILENCLALFEELVL
jgi:hypothetical protein